MCQTLNSVPGRKWQCCLYPQEDSTLCRRETFNNYWSHFSYSYKGDQHCCDKQVPLCRLGTPRNSSQAALDGQRWMDSYRSSSPWVGTPQKSVPGSQGSSSSGGPAIHSCLPWPALRSHSRALVLPGDTSQIKMNYLSLNLHLGVCFWESPAKVIGHREVSRGGGGPPEPRVIWVADC